MDMSRPACVPSGKQSRELSDAILVSELLPSKSCLGIRNDATRVIRVSDVRNLAAVETRVIRGRITRHKASIFAG